jgi:hypothetical protein
MKNAIWLLGRKEMVMWLLGRKQMSMWFQERKQNVNVVSGKKTKCQYGFRKENKMSIHTTTQCPCGFRKENKMSMWF